MHTFSGSARPACLAAALLAALGSTMPALQAGEASPAKATHSNTGAPHRPSPSAAIRNVTKCDDDGSAGTLRVEIFLAQSGDTIDLSQLTCGTITLGSAINVSQSSLYLLGPDADHLTIDGASYSKVFNHTGGGTFAVNRLTIAHGNGYLGGFNDSKGGCVQSAGNVSLSNSIVTHCTARSDDPGVPAQGGAVYTVGNLSLANSTISDSRAYAAVDLASGGGAYVRGDFTATYSTVSDNTADDNGALDSRAGGIFVLGDAVIYGSTISGNRSDATGGIVVGGGTSHAAEIVNSTISANLASKGAGGIWTNAPLSLFNATVAFNRQSGADNGAGLYSSDAALNLKSSIIAGNVGSGGASDLGGSPAVQVVAVADLIVESSLPIPAATIRTCPRLGPLSYNGGDTRSHALLQSSPAIDNGSTVMNLGNDQRYAPRLVGVSVDAGSIERQVGEIDDRLLVAGFDGLCDQ
jgi:hypothetical protein